jgi:hypothetical protein
VSIRPSRFGGILARKSDLPAPFGAPCLIGRSRPIRLYPTFAPVRVKPKLCRQVSPHLTKAQQSVTNPMLLDGTCGEFLWDVANEAARLKKKVSQYALSPPIRCASSARAQWRL